MVASRKRVKLGSSSKSGGKLEESTRPMFHFMRVYSKMLFRETAQGERA